MQIHFWGAARTVTGSAHFIKVNGHTLLLDCGLFQGRRKDTYRINNEFPIAPEDVDAVVVSHAHIDHIGNLPNLVKHGYEGPIYAHSATAHLAELMLKDSAHIQEYDVRFVNKRRERQGKPPVEPLYTSEDAQKAISQIEERAMEKTYEPVPGVQVYHVEAGHILGSTAIVMDIEEKGKKTRLWFSGDIGRPHLPILRDPVFPSGADYMIMESTYGDRPHEPYQKAQDQLQSIIEKTLRREGKVIIPAFAVGRTQELVYAIHRMMDAGDVPKVPVFVDSPLAVNVTDVFKRHPECFDEEAYGMIDNDEHRAALGFDSLTYIRSVEESKELNRREDPMIIISASGMMENGRILHHLRHNIHDARSTLLIVSWMAPHTLGRRMLEGAKQAKIYGETYNVSIQVERARGFSAHAGQNLLAEYALNMKGRLKELFLVHGEERGAGNLMEMLGERGMDKVHFPERGTIFEI